MAIKVGRQLLRRYPALGSTWPLEQARAWRTRRSWRQQPRRMASWYRDAVDLHTRVCVSNLEVPEAPRLCEPVTVLLTLFDAEGADLVSKRYPLGRNQSLMLEMNSLL